MCFLVSWTLCDIHFLLPLLLQPAWKARCHAANSHWRHHHGSHTNTHTHTSMLLLTMMTLVLLHIKGSDMGQGLILCYCLNFWSQCCWPLALDSFFFFPSFYWLSRKVIEGKAQSHIQCSQPQHRTSILHSCGTRYMAETPSHRLAQTHCHLVTWTLSLVCFGLPSA